MVATARLVEYVGVSAYLGASSIVSDKDLLVTAAEVLTVEARHQTILNILIGATAIPQAFDMALLPPSVLAIASGFISGCTLPITGMLFLISGVFDRAKTKVGDSQPIVSSDEHGFCSGWNTVELQVFRH